MVGLGVFTEAAVPFRPLGANEVEIPGLELFDDEQLGELAKLVRNNDVLVNPPGHADAAVSEAVPTPVAAEVGDPPPKSGPGATREAWAAYAEELSKAGVAVTVRDDMSRDQIIEAVEAVQS